MIINGDALAALQEMESDSVDSLVTDPPAGISFMGKEWDSDKGGRDKWIEWLTEVMRECYRVLKPGAHGLVWAIPRTSHWTATALENAGFEVRDVVTHLFGTGFPKSMDISKAIDKAAGAERPVIGSRVADDIRGGNLVNQESKTHVINITAPATDAAKQWSGFGTALKPASEHWILIRKPLGEKTVAANVLKHGVGGINIDGTRIRTDELAGKVYNNKGDNLSFGGTYGKGTVQGNAIGRFPANLVLSEGADEALDAQADDNVSRFFYCAKASKADRNAGCDGMSEKETGIKNASGRGFSENDPYKKVMNQNNHPTVKSTALMRYLCRLVTPPNGTILDPFMGSGSTGVAAIKEGFEFIGIELNPEYFEIAKKRLESV